MKYQTRKNRLDPMNIETNRFMHIQSRTDKYKNSFYVRTIPIWNSLSHEIINSNSIEILKSKMKKIDNL